MGDKKAIISDKIYMHADNALVMELAKHLTYRIEVKKGAGGKQMAIETIRNYSIPKAGVIAIPQGRQDLIPEGYVIEDKRTVITIDFPMPLHPLRDSQQPIWDVFDDSGFLNAKVGWGKTYTALHIAAKFGQKTLVVCHNTMLRDQWMKDVRTLFGIEPGIIGSGEFNIDSPIVIANVQTMTKLTESLRDSFGTIIMDEAHHVPATTFTNIIGSSKARYRIALSGTIKRKDGKQVLFKDYFGPKMYSPPQSDTLNPRIGVIKTGRRLKPGVGWVDKINDLHTDPDYIDFVASVARVQMSKGHKVLVVADRVEFLRLVHDRIGSESILVVGELDFDGRQKAQVDIETPHYNAICGSRTIFAEGISINCLSCIILATPYSSEILLEQLIGRIQRMYPGKLKPLAIDMHFAGLAERKQNNIRLAFYLMQGWDVTIL